MPNPLAKLLKRQDSPKIEPDASSTEDLEVASHGSISKSLAEHITERQSALKSTWIGGQETEDVTHCLRISSINSSLSPPDSPQNDLNPFRRPESDYTPPTANMPANFVVVPRHSEEDDIGELRCERMVKTPSTVKRRSMQLPSSFRSNSMGPGLRSNSICLEVGDAFGKIETMVASPLLWEPVSRADAASSSNTDSDQEDCLDAPLRTVTSNLPPETTPHVSAAAAAAAAFGLDTPYKPSTSLPRGSVLALHRANSIKKGSNAFATGSAGSSMVAQSSIASSSGATLLSEPSWGIPGAQLGAPLTGGPSAGSLMRASMSHSVPLLAVMEQTGMGPRGPSAGPSGGPSPAYRSSSSASSSGSVWKSNSALSGSSSSSHRSTIAAASEALRRASLNQQPVPAPRFASAPSAPDALRRGSLQISRSSTTLSTSHQTSNTAGVPEAFRRGSLQISRSSMVSTSDLTRSSASSGLYRSNSNSPTHSNSPQQTQPNSTLALARDSYRRDRAAAKVPSKPSSPSKSPSLSPSHTPSKSPSRPPSKPRSPAERYPTAVPLSDNGSAPPKITASYPNPFLHITTEETASPSPFGVAPSMAIQQKKSSRTPIRYPSTVQTTSESNFESDARGGSADEMYRIACPPHGYSDSPAESPTSSDGAQSPKAPTTKSFMDKIRGDRSCSKRKQGPRGPRARYPIIMPYSGANFGNGVPQLA